MKTNFTGSGARASRPSALALLLVCLLCFFGVKVARADISAPDNVLYGVIVFGTNQVTPGASAFSVEARRPNGSVVARYRMGDRADLGNFYLLTLKLEEIAPLSDPASLLVNESLTIAVVSNGVDRAAQSFTVSERGQVQRLDFGSLPTNTLSGFELWAVEHGLGANSQDLDADADGLSNFAEYTAGTDPNDPAGKFVLRISTANALPRVSFDALRADGTGYEGRVRHYALQQRSAVSSGSWQTVPGYGDITGLNQVVAYDPPPNAAPLFFRGLVWLDNPADGGFQLSTSLNSGQATISFTALGPDLLGRNRYYTMEYKTDLVGQWVAVPGCSNILGAGQTVTYPISTTGPNRTYYRGRYEVR